jgi:hypothetical protein
VVGIKIYEAICSSNEPYQLHDISKELWRNNGEGKVNDEEASYLSHIIESRRPLRRTVPGHTKLGVVSGRLFSRFATRKRQDRPTVRRQGIGAGRLADRAHRLPISDLTTPRGNGRCCASSPARSSVRACASFPLISSPRSRPSVERRCRAPCMRRDGSVTLRSPSVRGVAARTFPTWSRSSPPTGALGYGELHLLHAR